MFQPAKSKPELVTIWPQLVQHLVEKPTIKDLAPHCSPELGNLHRQGIKVFVLHAEEEAVFIHFSIAVLGIAHADKLFRAGNVSKHRFIKIRWKDITHDYM